ncbi:MAG: VanW family protein [Velocimicrobium sp.]
MKNKKTIAIIVIAVCILLACTIAGITVFAGLDTNTICKGVNINTVDVSGMTKEEAIDALSQYMKTVETKKILVYVDDNQVTTTASTFGVEADMDNAVEQALSTGKTGNFIKRYKEIKDLEKQALVIPLTVTVDDKKIKEFVKKQCSVFDIPAENAKITRVNGEFVISDHVIGRKVDVSDTVEVIDTMMCKEWEFEAATVKAVVIDDVPEYTSDTLALCRDVLGTYSTTYSTSSQSRANNLANGAKLINGSIIWPGETFSTGKRLQPITVDNGYSIAGAYENGQVVDSVGGGVCQVATTLYNATLVAELEVAQRNNHSMIVGYVKPSMDAAIAGDYKDLKITNNTKVPVYIEASTVGRTITFTLYGHETRDKANRTVAYESKVLKVIQPGKDKITKDKTQLKSYRKVTQSAHVGYKAELWKVVYENGVETSRERINSSSYAAEPAYVTVGTKKEKKEDEEESDDAVVTESPVPSETVSSSPSPSEKPVPSKTVEPSATLSPLPTSSPSQSPKNEDLSEE